MAVKETKEAGLGLIILAKKIAIAIKNAKKDDGKVDFKDIGEFAKLLGDAELVAAIGVAVDGIDKVGGEVKEITFGEALQLVSELGMAAYDAVQEIEAA